MLVFALIYVIPIFGCEATRVKISQGTLVGKKTKTENDFPYYEYLQIPYAKPPVGDLRFKSPQPPESWKGERNATESSDDHVCIHYNSIRNITTGTEDCLYLNVFTPTRPDETNKKPVMVFIHAGGYQLGNGILKDENGPDYLIEHDVVVVFINYRLGIFGFLSLDIPEAAGNMGLKDQVMALKWVKENIEHFGGDKNNIAIGGISAGGSSVEYHMLSPLSKGLFNKAIIQSGSTLNHWAINYDIKEVGVLTAIQLGFNSSSDDIQNVYKTLFNANPLDLLEASVNVIDSSTSKSLVFAFVPSIEKDFRNGDTFLAEYPYNVLKEGRFHKVPVLRGFCEFEGYLFAYSKPQGLVDIAENKKFTNFWRYKLESDDIIEYNNLFKKIYFDDNRSNYNEQAAINFFTDFDFVSGILISSKLMSSNGIDPYVYKFAYDGNMNMLKIMLNMQRKGAAHADDTAYLFTIFHRDLINITQSDDLTIKRMTKMWTDFAKTGNPTPNTTDIIPIKWPAFNVDQQKYFVINKDLTVESSYEPEKMAVFERIYSKYKK